MTLKLSDPSLLEHRAFVAGEWKTGERTFAVSNPATGEGQALVFDVS